MKKVVEGSHAVSEAARLAKVEVIAGINLPMLIKLASVRDENNLKDAVDQAQDSGRKYINVASSVLSGEEH